MQKLNDSFKKDKPQINSKNTKKDRKLLMKELVFKKGLAGSKTNGPIDQALSSWKPVRARRPTCSIDQIRIARRINGLYLTIAAET